MAIIWNSDVSPRLAQDFQQVRMVLQWHVGFVVWVLAEWEEGKAPKKWEGVRFLLPLAGWTQRSEEVERGEELCRGGGRLCWVGYRCDLVVCGSSSEVLNSNEFTQLSTLVPSACYTWVLCTLVHHLYRITGIGSSSVKPLPNIYQLARV